MPLEAAFEQALGAIVLALEMAAAFVIASAAARALWHYLVGVLFARQTPDAERRPIRLDFGRSLLLGLDFAIGSDVLKVALTPTFEAVAVVGLVVLVRVALTLLLEFELSRGRREAAKSS